MNHQEFKDAFAEMTTVYGEKAYPPAMRSKLFYFVSKVDLIDFKRVLDTIIMEHNRPPAIGIIAKSCYPFLRDAANRAQIAAIKELEARKGRCPECDNAGMVFMYSRENWGHEFAFKCLACDAWQCRKIGAIPPWRPVLAKDFMTLKEKWDLEAQVQAKAPKLAPTEREALRRKLMAMASELPTDSFTWGEL